MIHTITESRLELPLWTRGKVRDVYAVGDDALLIVATDRLSAFDHVLPTPVPGKGRVLTQLSAFWFSELADLVPHHMITADVDEIALRLPQVGVAAREMLRGRVMLVTRCRRIDMECVVRGYLAGSAMDEYHRAGMIAGIAQPAGLRPGDRLPEPIFTPATKAASGHDENLTFAQMVDRLGGTTSRTLRELSLALYRRAGAHAASRGLILADTKFEFGQDKGHLVLMDEALTPDSSRFWDAAQYPASLVAFDKQFVRDYLNGIGWNHEPPVPPLPDDVVAATRERYLETYRRLTGRELL